MAHANGAGCPRPVRLRATLARRLSPGSFRVPPASAARVGRESPERPSLPAYAYATLPPVNGGEDNATRKLPISIQTFGEIRGEGHYYADKTPHIERLIEQGKHYFLSRPRRFGKRLLLDGVERTHDMAPRHAPPAARLRHLIEALHERASLPDRRQIQRETPQHHRLRKRRSVIHPPVIPRHRRRRINGQMDSPRRADSNTMRHDLPTRRTT